MPLAKISEQVNIDERVLLSLEQCKLPNWILFQADYVANFIFFYEHCCIIPFSISVGEEFCTSTLEAGCQL